MTEQAFVWKDQKKLRMGYTTGSCAAAAAKAAARMLFLGEEIRQVSLMTPKGIRLYLDVEDILRMKDKVRCAIRKDAGDDPDVTDQILVYAEVSKTEESRAHWMAALVSDVLPEKDWSRISAMPRSIKFQEP